MKASEVIFRLAQLITEHGDLDVLIDAGGLLLIDEIDVDTEDTGIIIWPVYQGEEAA